MEHFFFRIAIGNIIKRVDCYFYLVSAVNVDTVVKQLFNYRHIPSRRCFVQLLFWPYHCEKNSNFYCVINEYIPYRPIYLMKYDSPYQMLGFE